MLQRKQSKKRRRAARARWEGRRKRLLGWVAGVVSGVLVAVVGGGAVGAVTGLIDVAALQDRFSSGPDIAVSLELSRYENGYSVAFTGHYEPTAAQGQMMRDGGQWESLFDELMAAGGWRVGHSTISVDVQGRRNQVVQVIDMRVVPRHADGASMPVAAGTLFDEPAQGGGPATRVGFDLDAAHPVARDFDGVHGLGARYFPSHLNTLRKGEVERFEVELESGKALRHEFTIAIDYRVGSHRHTITLQHEGHPHVFRMTGPACPKGTPTPGYSDGYTMAYRPRVHLVPLKHLPGQEQVCPAV